MNRSVRILLLTSLLCLMPLLAACEHLAAVREPMPEPPQEAIMLSPPVIETAQDVVAEPTVLEKYTDACRIAEEQRALAKTLRSELDQVKADRDRAKSDLQLATQQVDFLTKQKTQLDKVAKEYEAAQEKMMELGTTVRDLRHDLLKERLTRVKLEQTILTLRIQMAKAKRQEILNSADKKLTYSQPKPEDGDVN